MSETPETMRCSKDIHVFVEFESLRCACGKEARPGSPPAPDAGVEEARELALILRQHAAALTVSGDSTEAQLARLGVGAAPEVMRLAADVLEQAEQRLRAVEAERDVLKHEQALIEDRLKGRGITDCSTPLFIRVQNVVEELQAREAASPPVPDPALSDDDIVQCIKAVGAVGLNIVGGKAKKLELLDRLSALRTPAPTPDETGA